MTLAQLQSFVLVARHGSVKAAAAELEVTEPAVSVAVSALKKELGDDLFVRSGRGIALTPGGRRLAALATEILGLAEQARRSVAENSGEPRRLSVLATPQVAEHIGPLIELFTARDEDAGDRGRGRLRRLVRRSARAPARGHRARPAARAPPRRSPPPRSCAARLILVAAPSHPLAGARAIAPSALAGERWLLGQPELDPAEATGAFLARHGLSPDAVATYSSGAAAIAAAAAGEGIILTLAHAVVDEVRRRALVRLDVRGTPLVEMWHASTLGLGRALPAALALQRFATTAEATQAISTGRAGAVSTFVRPKVHVTLWRSVADEIDAAAG